MRGSLICDGVRVIVMCRCEGEGGEGGELVQSISQTWNTNGSGDCQHFEATRCALVNKNLG